MGDAITLDPSAVIIVSAFGRGHTLAMELSMAEIPVGLLDVSTRLGNTSPEEWEGPFALSLSGLSGTQKERLIEDDPIHSQSEGVVVLLPSGPLELRGPLSEHRLASLGIPATVRELLRVEMISDSTKQKLATQNYSEQWILHVLRQVHSNRKLSPTQTLSLPMKFGSESDLAVRDVTRLGIFKSLEAVGRRGVHVFKTGTVRDISSVRRSSNPRIEFCEVGTELSQTIPFGSLVWCLTSEETHFLSSALGRRLFGKEPQTPEWHWSKFRFRLDSSSERDSLPRHSIWIEHPDLPMTHENLLIVQRTANAELFDIWMLLPSAMRFQRSYMQERAEMILRRLKKQSSGFNAELAEEPLTKDRTLEEVGPARFPVYGAAWEIPKPPADFVWFHSAETWSGHGWLHLFEHDQVLKTKIGYWWKQVLADREKKKLREKDKT